MEPHDEGWTPRLEAARKRRVELHDALVEVEDAIAHPAGQLDAWGLGVAKAVTHLRDAFEEHVRGTEGQGGLYEEILQLAPRLAGKVNRLHEEHPEWESRAIDAQLKGSLDGATGKAEATLTLFDGELLGDVSASLDLDLPALADHPARRWQNLLGAPIAGRISIPRRAVSSFRTLPAFARQYLPPIQGEVRLDAYADGTLARQTPW